jgi:hypothetical protein
MPRGSRLNIAVLCCVATALVWPLFHLDYLDNWKSIESTFIADARMLSANLPHPGWQPLWYCGTRFDYIYPPALRYGTALLSKLGHTSTARSYHRYTAIFYVFGIIAVYWLVITGTGSRGAAFVAAIATALLSPSFWLLPVIQADSPWNVPQRLHVLTHYGEGPHISALSVLPAALAAAFLALRKLRPGYVVLAAALAALVTATNFYGATALAIFFPIMVWAVWTGERTWNVWWRAGAIAALAYGLSAFWLTPSYLKITRVNLHWVSLPGNTRSMIIAAVLAAVFCAISGWFGQPNREWTIFVAGSAVFLTVYVVGYFYWDFHVSGDAARLLPELDLALILAAIEIIRGLWTMPRWRIPAAVAVLLAFVPAWTYLQHVWSPFPKAKSLNTQYEYRLTKWVHEHLPGERVLPSGSNRYWYDAWFDNSQPDGGSMQGMLNQIYPVAGWQMLHGDRADVALLWLQALGAGAVIVPEKTSLEPFHDYEHPEKFRGAATVLYDDQQGTIVYAVERVHPGIGRIVSREAIQTIGKIRGGVDRETLANYVAVIENPEQPVTGVTWRGSDEVEIDAQVSASQSVLLQESYDPAWHAYENGKELAVRTEPVMSFMLLDVPAGRHAIQMRFEVPLENRVGQILFAISVLACIALLLRERRLGQRD